MWNAFCALSAWHDEVLRRCGLDATEIIRATVEAVDLFTGGHPPEDDRTLLVARVS